MRRVLLLMGMLLGATMGLAIGAAIAGTMAVRRLVPAERREELRERLSRVPGSMMEGMMERMPEDAPPKVMTSGVRHIQEQNEELLALMREQNELLRERLPVGEPSPRRSRRSAAEKR